MFLLTLLSSGRPGTEADLLLGDLRPLVIPKYGLPLVLFACGACLYMFQRPDGFVRKEALAGAAKVLGVWSDITSEVLGWLLGVAVLAISHAPPNALPAAAVLAFGLTVLLGPRFMLAQVIGLVADDTRRLFFPAWRRDVAWACGLGTMLCGLAWLLGNVAEQVI